MTLLLVDMTAVPGKRDALIANVHDLLSVGPAGLLQYAIGVATDDPDTIAIVQEWHDDAAEIAFKAGESFADFFSENDSLFQTSPRERRYAIDVPRPPETPIISLL